MRGLCEIFVQHRQGVDSWNSGYSFRHVISGVLSSRADGSRVIMITIGPQEITLNPVAKNNGIGWLYQHFLYLLADPRHRSNIRISFCSTTTFQIATLNSLFISGKGNSTRIALFRKHHWEGEKKRHIVIPTLCIVSSLILKLQIFRPLQNFNLWISPQSPWFQAEISCSIDSRSV